MATYREIAAHSAHDMVSGLVPDSQFRFFPTCFYSFLFLLLFIYLFFLLLLYLFYFIFFLILSFPGHCLLLSTFSDVSMVGEQKYHFLQCRQQKQ